MARPTLESQLLARFDKFLTNDWIHLEQKVAALQAQTRLIIGMLSVLVGLVIYTALNNT
jgi:hypothetical protein